MKTHVRAVFCSAALLLNRAAHANATGGGSSSNWLFSLPPRDPALYDELGVSPTASKNEIRRDRFKRVAEAYQVLQDDAARAAYHTYGLEQTSDMDPHDHYRFGPLGPVLDPHEVFRLYVGGGKFQQIIGDLAPKNADLPAEDGAHGDWDVYAPSASPSRSKGSVEAQRDARARQLAEALLAKLEVYVGGDVGGFERAAWAEALALRPELLLLLLLLLRAAGPAESEKYTNYGHRTAGKLAGGPLRAAAIQGQLNFYAERASTLRNLAAAASTSTGLMLKLKIRGSKNTERQGPTQWLKRGGARGGSAPQTGSATPTAGDAEDVAMIGSALWKVHRP
ncbi:hypothetical protein JKP88DRAFT_347192 [Tribonema minus]|uniref:J domain-containing protein n=1 Tax=Tribonema minus TaxID=303371 RepID=A0A836C8Q7_9STRA|nr:hypothetical protein JKP88DRAFT_347192 [Tribonema minus]